VQWVVCCVRIYSASYTLDEQTSNFSKTLAYAVRTLVLSCP
jgi:hypothetical protein